MLVDSVIPSHENLQNLEESRKPKKLTTAWTSIKNASFRRKRNTSIKEEFQEVIISESTVVSRRFELLKM